MMQAIWLAGLAVANVWAAGNLGSLGVPNNTEKGLLGGAAVGTGAGALIGRGNSDIIILDAHGLRANRKLTIEDVCQLSEQRVPDQIIINQLSSTRTNFNLRVDDIIYLRQKNVSDRVIAEMQTRQLDRESSRLPVTPSLPPGQRVMCEEPPTHQEILRAMPRVTRGVPFVYEEFRDNIEITTEKLVDRIDPPRFYPLIGPAQLHHCHWKCTVYFTETVEVSYPFPMKTQRRRSEVVYIDKDVLHLCFGEPMTMRPRYTVDSSFQEKVCFADDALHPNRKIPGLMGRVWIFTDKFEPTHADGCLTIEMIDQNPDAMGKPQLLSVWNFDAAVLKQLESNDNIGVGYSLFLPCDPASARVERVKLTVTYTPTAGHAATMETAVLKLRPIDGLSPAGQWEESNEPPLYPTPKKVSMADLIDGGTGAVICADSKPATEIPAYRVAAPDVLTLDACKLVSRSGKEMPQALQQIRGEHLVRPDGTISLGTLGCVKVDGMTIAQIKNVVEHHLGAHFVEPSVAVDIKAYNSSKYYVILDCKTHGQHVMAFPCTGSDLVIDALTQVPLPKGNLKIWVARPTKCESEIMPVDWKAMTEQGVTRTNYLLKAGDRLHIVSEPAPPVATAAKSQVHLAVLIAELDAAMLKKLPFSAVGNEHVRFEVLSGDLFINKLQGLRDEGKAKFIARPSVLTLSGQRATVMMGGETPFLVSGNGERSRISFNRLGTTLNLLPTVQQDGSIQLEVRGEVCQQVGNDAKYAHVTAKMRDGQTIVINGESLRKDNLHRLIIVTTHVVQSNCEQPATCVAPMPIVAKCCQTMTFADVVQLSKRGISEDIILRQMEQTQATFSLSVADILYLNEQGVSDAIIRAMQMRATGSNPNRTRTSATSSQ